MNVPGEAQTQCGSTKSHSFVASDRESAEHRGHDRLGRRHDRRRAGL